MRHRIFGRTRRLLLWTALLGLWALNPSAGHHPATAFEPQRGDEDRDRAVMERFLAVLERDPRRGTALDRVYGYHVERGTLDALVQSYRDRAAGDPGDGLAPLLIGLIESQRGRDSAALASLREAERLRPDDPLPSYYLGQALVLVGQPGPAAEAFERALARKPSRTDLLEIFQALGRVYQRGRKDDQAVAVWARLEALFPDDPKVKEQVASSLAEEARYEPALARYEALGKSARDPYRRVQYRTEAADLKVKLGRQADALRDYEGLLEAVDPESWLSREIRRKVEDVFLRNEDQAGLSTYYEGWVARSPEDVEAMARLARSLANQGRAAEARSWLEKALKLAPSRKALRLALVEQLAQEKKFAEAASQYEAMVKLEPGNPDLVRDWGKMLLRDVSKPEGDRKKAASDAWRRLVDARPDDASTAAQVADLFRQAGLVDEAIALYQKAISLAPDSPQYREYLGEFYHTLKRTDDALATWRGMAAGPHRDAKALRRLGEVLAGFGYKAEAVDVASEAARLEPDSLDLRLRLADLLLALRRFDDADAQLAEAERLADDEEGRDEVLNRRVAVAEAAGRLPARLEALRKEVAGPKAGDAPTWRRLARYAEAARQPVEAVNAAEKAVALDPRSIASRVALARLYEATGRFGEAAEASRQLATLDRRSRTEHLIDVAKLEARLGRTEQALAAGRDLLAAAPGNAENLQFFADLCFQLGDNEQGLEALRRAVRSGESDPRPMIALAEALARDFRTEEAIEQYWRAFDRTNDLDGKLGLVAKLADLHLQRNQVDRLIARLERLARDEGKQREGALYLAQAFAAIGDYGTARVQLEGLLAANARDTALLKQLAKLAEDEGDLPAAVAFQKQLCEVAPDGESARRLVQLALRSGEFDVAEAVWSKSTEGDQDLSRVLSALDDLMTYGKYEAVLATTSKLLRKDPGNWEALYREARALQALDRPEEAARRFQDLLEIRLRDDEPSAIVKARQKAPPATTGTAASTAALPMVERIGVRFRQTITLNIRAYFGLEPGSSSALVNSWVPLEFAQARMAALAALLAKARRDNDEAGWLARRREARDKTPDDPRGLWDDYYLGLLRFEPRETYEVARALARISGRDISADTAFLMALNNRNNPSGVSPRQLAYEEPPDSGPPLPADELDLIRDAFLSLVRSRPSLVYGATQTTVTTELKKAGRLGEIDGTYREMVDSAKDLDTYTAAGSIASTRGDLDALRTLSKRFYRFPASGRSTVQPTQPYYIRTTQGVGIIPIPALYQVMAMRLKADAKAYPEILRVLDEELAALREPARVAERARATRTSTPSPSPPMYAVFTAPRQTLATIDFPTAGPYLDHGAILLLRNAYALFKRDDLLSDLRTHLRKVADDASGDPSAAVTTRLAYCALLWWSDERDEALRELARAIELAPKDAELKMSMAELRARRREPDEALAILDSIEAADQDLTRRRELLALRVAIQANRGDRAAQAAERLFGLRLDNSTQVQLASQMQQLGMNDLADAVLARTRRRVGNDTEALLALMNQYQRMGNAETAAQIAMQVLRRAPGGQSALLRGTSNLDEPAQRQAIQVLAGSGKLDEMIGRVEAQRKLSPQSVPVLQTLATYYRAANRPERVREVSEAIIRLRPDDLSLRIQLASQLVQAGDVAGAIDHYRAVLKKDPGQFSRYSTEIINAFRLAKDVDGLLKLIDEVGIKSISSYYALADFARTLMLDPKTFEPGMALLRKSWDAFPTERMSMLALVSDIDAFWKRPEATAYAREGIIAAPLSTRYLSTTWLGIDSITARNLDDGRIDTPATRLLDASARDNGLEALAAELEALVSRRPRWLAGKALVALIRVRQGRIDEAKPILEAILADPAANSAYYEPLVIIAQELKDIPATTTLALAYYERAMKETSAWNYVLINVPGSAVRQLTLLYRKAGRLADARAIVAKAVDYFAKSQGTANAAYYAHRKVSGLDSFAALSLEVGDPAGAIRGYNALLEGSEDIQLARAYLASLSASNLRSTYGNPNYTPIDTILEQARAGIEKALHGLDRELLAATLQSLVAPGGDRPPDLVLLVHPREVDRAAVTSLFTSALELASREPELLAKVRADLDSIAKARPGDIEAEIAATLAACAGLEPGSDAIVQAASRLDRLVASTPLEPLSEGAKANSRQRAEAARRLGLWLVARTCWAHDSTREVGDRLAASALEAARRQVDNLGALAMLRDWGLRALDQGDRKLAEGRWIALLDLVLANATAPASPRAPAPAARARTPVLTLDRFEQAAGLARLAAEHGMNDLSTRAVRESLKGGPPVVPVPLSTTPTVANRPRDAEPSPDLATLRVEASLVEVDALWARRGLPPSAAYETLRDVVLPASRPLEILLYNGPPERPARPSPAAAARPTPTPTPARASEVGRLLARRAVAAGRADDLRKRIADRQAQPTARAPAKALLDLLDAAEKEPH